ncbi:MAG: 3-hydroxyacyl-ACP dehydratase [Deltaproteobacteria bacterium]|nr:3-hydroxyacyl-ACP dehydratase [Candidatus Anaeroferrophillus wilburensis]MBN2888609.1 3-hydroxyacyl-ACP dehydratase [Deltaproteobacteria bacterium]
MRCAGIDLGSRTIEVVIVEDGRLVASRQAETGFAPDRQAASLLAGESYDRLLATGYGRHLFEQINGTPTVTEIKAVAAGFHALAPEVDLILDIGGQDSKVVALNQTGKVIKFEMNDRCAAGTGKFLELVAMTLGFPLDAFGQEALKAEKTLQINSMCAVFADSEVTSLIGRGEDRRAIALGLHRSIVNRAVGMLKRFNLDRSTIGFVGGVAWNPCVHRLLEEHLQKIVHIPPNPQIVAAYGAALLAAGG